MSKIEVKSSNEKLLVFPIISPTNNSQNNDVKVKNQTKISSKMLNPVLKQN